MNSRWVWLLSVVARRIWFRATLFSVAAVITALIAIFVSPHLPADLSTRIGANSVDEVLGIIASSMLTVTTFSLSTMVSAYSAATSNVTPRATRLVMEDSTTQNVLATFVGSFLFSLVGIIALTTGAYGDQGRVVLFLVTIAVIVLIVVTLLRWIDHLSRLGRVTETTRRVEETTIAAVRAWRQTPNLGGRALPENFEALKQGMSPVLGDWIGYVQHVDPGALARIAEDTEVDVYLVATPGKLVISSLPVAWTSRELDDDQTRRLASSLTIGDIRSFDLDPRFGASVLAEIASRALSPAVNDPGTAIDVISRAMRILAEWHGDIAEEGRPIPYPRLFVAPVTTEDLFDDLFTPIARDGAGLVEVGIRLQKTLSMLSSLSPEFRENAQRHSKEAIERADVAFHIEADRKRLRDVAAGFS